MFSKVLVANRGEIAVRVMRACRELGVRSVAVYSEADRGALHARYADEAYCIGGPTAAESYLNAAAIVACARACGADAVHPGYGFLSEQADFAEACAAAGIKFIGPSPATLRLVGDKVAAREVAMRANVPTVPGSQGRVTADEALAAADRIGYPLLIKAAAGGGGKGIRRVDKPDELENAVRTAAAEAEASFGDGGLYVERYLDPVRHIEVQVVADEHGGIVHLGERECSLQRRSQKIVEESPSPAVDAALRERLGAAAVAVMREAGYENAGTVEFLFDDATREFYFIEVNARIQVEHPVTELVTGIDLIQTQLRLAAGEALGLTQDDIVLRGWAIECRLTAEDAEQGFLPSLGHVSLVNEPSGPGVRVDSSLFTGHGGRAVLRLDAGQGHRMGPGPPGGAGPAATRPGRVRAAGREDDAALPATPGRRRGLRVRRHLHPLPRKPHRPVRAWNGRTTATTSCWRQRCSAIDGATAARRQPTARPRLQPGSSMWRTAAKRAAVDRHGGASWRSTT